MGSSRVYTAKYLTNATMVRELARANDIIDKVKRQAPSTNAELRKGCEKAAKTVNRLIVDLLGGERDE